VIPTKVTRWILFMRLFDCRSVIQSLYLVYVNSNILFYMLNYYCSRCYHRIDFCRCHDGGSYDDDDTDEYEYDEDLDDPDSPYWQSDEGYTPRETDIAIAPTSPIAAIPIVFTANVSTTFPIGIIEDTQIHANSNSATTVNWGLTIAGAQQPTLRYFSTWQNSDGTYKPAKFVIPYFHPGGTQDFSVIITYGSTSTAFGAIYVICPEANGTYRATVEDIAFTTNKRYTYKPPLPTSPLRGFAPGWYYIQTVLDCGSTDSQFNLISITTTVPTGFEWTTEPAIRYKCRPRGTNTPVFEADGTLRGYDPGYDVDIPVNGGNANVTTWCNPRLFSLSRSEMKLLSPGDNRLVYGSNVGGDPFSSTLLRIQDTTRPAIPTTGIYTDDQVQTLSIIRKPGAGFELYGCMRLAPITIRSQDASYNLTPYSNWPIGTTNQPQTYTVDYMNAVCSGKGWSFHSFRLQVQADDTTALIPYYHDGVTSIQMSITGDPSNNRWTLKCPEITTTYSVVVTPGSGSIVLTYTRTQALSVLVPQGWYYFQFINHQTSPVYGERECTFGTMVTKVPIGYSWTNVYPNNIPIVIQSGTTPLSFDSDGFHILTPTNNSVFKMKIPRNPIPNGSTQNLNPTPIIGVRGQLTTVTDSQRLSACNTGRMGAMQYFAIPTSSIVVEGSDTTIQYTNQNSVDSRVVYVLYLKKN
jgi:hypothetical protein